jgi:hypothetical protein
MKTKSSTPLIVGGALTALVALAALAAAAGLLWVNASHNSQGYLQTSAHGFHTTSRALVSMTVTVNSAVPSWFVDDVRVKAAGDKALFVGVARQSDVNAYLRGVSSASVEDLDADPFHVTYVAHSGSRVPEAPAAARIWDASSPQDLRWHVKKGKWAIVLMNADRSPGVAADVSVGAKLGGGVLWTVVGGLLALGLGFGGLAAFLLVKGSRGRAL